MYLPYATGPLRARRRESRSHRAALAPAAPFRQPLFFDDERAGQNQNPGKHENAIG
jgi:hypothetical protein